MRVNKSIVVGIVMLIASGFGGILWYSFKTIIDNKMKTNEVQRSITIMNDKFDTYITMQREQNREMNKRVDGIKDTLTIQGIRNDRGHDRIDSKLNRVISISKKTSKDFRDYWNVSKR